MALWLWVAPTGETTQFVGSCGPHFVLFVVGGLASRTFARANNSNNNRTTPSHTPTFRSKNKQQTRLLFLPLNSSQKAVTVLSRVCVFLEKATHLWISRLREPISGADGFVTSQSACLRAFTPVQRFLSGGAFLRVGQNWPSKQEFSKSARLELFRIQNWTWMDMVAVQGSEGIRVPSFVLALMIRNNSVDTRVCVRAKLFRNQRWR